MLTDSPYKASSQTFFSFSRTDTHDLVQDLIHGNPTCYLISGYRGAGKSSFVKRLEEEVRLIQNETLFIDLNFAKYEPKSILLRKLIRNFYLRLTDADYEKLYSRLKLVKELERPLDELSDLYDRTFYDVAKNSNTKITNSISKSTKIEADFEQLFGVGSGVLAVVVLSLKLDLSQWQSYLPIAVVSLLAALAPVLKWVTFTRIKENVRLEEHEKSKRELYDDEIAEHSLLKVLSMFQQETRPVFVLDELDKVPDELVEDLINELKPVMLAGYASFIIVAGQDLYYKYYDAHAKDDNALSSLFSKEHHVPLLAPAELRLLFNKLVLTDTGQLNETERVAIEDFINYLIVKSKCIPRRFISLIRQQLTWEEGKAFLPIDALHEIYKRYSDALTVIERIQNQVINAQGYAKPIADYIGMQLFIKLESELAKQVPVFSVK